MQRVTSTTILLVSAGLLLAACSSTEDSSDAGASGNTGAIDSSCDEGEFVVNGECTTLSAPWNRIDTGGETICSRGEPYHFYVHPGAKDKVLLYFAFGGFCYNAELCREGAPNYIPAIDVDESVLAMTGGIIDLANAENPFKDWTIVYLPECTADFQSGNNVAEYPPLNGSPAITINHKGFVNATAVREWVYANYESPERIVVSGSSGGGDAAVVHYPFLRDHYKDVQNWVLLLDSSFGVTTEDFLTTLTTGWKAYEQRPTFIPEIANASAAQLTWDFIEITANNFYPNGIIAELGTAYDLLEGFTYSIHGGDQADWHDKMQAHLENVSENADRYRYYVAAGTGHIILNQSTFYQYDINGTRMRDWVADLAEGKDVTSIQCTDNCMVNPVLDTGGPGQEIGISCLGSTHCNVGQVCCGDLMSQSATCADACVLPQTQLCIDVADCGSSSMCSKLEVMGVDLGICLPDLTMADAGAGDAPDAGAGE